MIYVDGHPTADGDGFFSGRVTQGLTDLKDARSDAVFCLCGAETVLAEHL
jgi:hypothetical protein